MKIKLHCGRSLIRKRLLLSIMKTFIFLLCTTVFSLTTENTFSQEKIKIDKDQLMSVDQVFEIIQEQTKYAFMYPENFFNDVPKIELKKGEISLNDLVKLSIPKSKLNFKLTEDNVIVFSEHVKTQEVDIEIDQQQITGIVTDNSAVPLPGVNILKVGTTTGTQTDFDGNYVINANKGDVLEFSYVGMKTVTITVGDDNVINVILNEDAAQLEEVVVVGYGTKKKINLTGAVDAVTAKEIVEDRGVANVGEALQGRLPGLNIDYGSGDIDATPRINLRGVTGLDDEDTSLSASPLILIDNIPSTIEVLTQMNPEDVESISILKDASAAAIYGGRASFGVILVTTKTGKNKKFTATVNSYVRLSRQTEFPEFANSYQHMLNVNTALANAGNSVRFDDDLLASVRAYHQDPANNPIDEIRNPVYDADGNVIGGDYRFYGTTDYMDLVYKRALYQTKHDLSFSGGTENTSVYASFGVLEDEGLFKIGNEERQVYNMRVNTTSQLNDWLQIGTRVAYVKRKFDAPLQSGRFGNLTKNTYFQRVYHPLINPGNGLFTNHTIAYLANGNRDIYEDDDITLNLNAKIDLSKNLSLNGSFAYKSNIGLNTEVNPANTVADNGVTFPIAILWDIIPTSYVRERTRTIRDNVLDLYAQYDNTFGEKHNVGVLVGFNQQNTQEKAYAVRRNDLVSESVPSLNLASGDITIGQDAAQRAIRGAFYRANYDYDGKYLLELSGRYDGSSSFAKDVRFGFFPSGSLGWRVSKENFMESTKNWLSDLKFRVSYGELGNQAGASDFAYIANLGSDAQPDILIDGDWPLVVTAPGLVDPGVTWESVNTLNFGLDAAFFNNRLGATLDVFKRETIGIRVGSTPAPGLLGADTPIRNSADTESKGWEATLSWRDKIGDDFTYGIRVNVSDDRAFVTRAEFNPLGFLSNFREGQEVGEIWGFETEGLFQTQADADEAMAGGSHDQTDLHGGQWFAGDVKYVDLNGDGKIDDGLGTENDPGDLKVIGNARARYRYGINLNASYKGFGFEAFFQGVGKRQFMPNDGSFFPYQSTFHNAQLWQLGTWWTPDNPDAYFARLTDRNNARNRQTQTRFLQNAAYIRLKSLSITYKLPQSVLDKLPITGLTLSLNGRNLWEAHKLKPTFDPEGGQGLQTPFRRTYTLGLKVNL